MSTGSNKQWEAITLSSICSTAKNIKWNEERDDREYRYIDLTSVDRVSHTIVSPQVINKSNAPSRAQKIVVTNDVLFATTRPTLRRYCLIGSDFNNQICSTGYCVIRPNQTRILPSWIYYLLTSDAFYNYIEPLQTGATYPAVTDKDVLKYAVPLPSLSEQQRIVGILDAEFEKIDALKANAEKNLQNAKDLFQAALKKELEPKNGWKTHSIEEVSAKIFAGGDVPNDSLSKVQTTKYNVPIVSNGIEQDGLYGYTEFAKVNEPAITISGRGTIGYVVERLNPFYPIVRLITIIPKLDEIITRYLYYSLRNVDFSHTGSSIPQLTVPMVKDKTICVPTVAEQGQIAFRLDTLSAKCKELQDNYTQTIALCDDLKQALLRKAFSGEL